MKTRVSQMMAALLIALAVLAWLVARPLLEVPGMGTLGCRDTWKEATWLLRSALGAAAIFVVLRWWHLALFALGSAMTSFGLVLVKAYTKVTSLLDDPAMDDTMREMIQTTLDGTRKLPALYASAGVFLLALAGMAYAQHLSNRAYRPPPT